MSLKITAALNYRAPLIRYRIEQNKSIYNTYKSNAENTVAILTEGFYSFSQIMTKQPYVSRYH